MPRKSLAPGFVRVALESGVDIVPVYYFGQSQLFCNYGPPFLACLSRKWRVAVVGYLKKGEIQNVVETHLISSQGL
eukprot:scaffold197660_cov15-Tisochrysis_lutea.AAC.1